MEEEEENAAKEEKCINLSDDKIGAPCGSEPLLSGRHLTSPNVDREVLRRRNVMTLRILFSNNAIVKRAELPPPGSTIES